MKIERNHAGAFPELLIRPPTINFIRKTPKIAKEMSTKTSPNIFLSEDVLILLDLELFLVVVSKSR